MMDRWVKVKIKDEATLRYAGLEMWTPPEANLLDHGFIRMVDFMGDDSAIVQGARVSYGNGTKSLNEDRSLIRYMLRNHHTSPFEQAELKFHVKAPIFVFRQWHRHRTANINELSGRYSLLPEEMYVPAQDHTAVQSTSNKQGREAAVVSEADYLAITTTLDTAMDTAYKTYEYLVGENKVPPDSGQQARLMVEQAAIDAIRVMRAQHPEEVWDAQRVDETIQSFCNAQQIPVLSKDFTGLSRELARIILPLSTYSEMYWKCDLHNIFHFLHLRMDSHAQYEIRVYANAMLDQIRQVFPLAVEAFEDYVLNGETFSAGEMKILRMMFAQYNTSTEPLDHLDTSAAVQRASGLSKREAEEFLSKLNTT